MNPKILLVDASKPYSSSLKVRLDSLGADVKIVGSRSEIFENFAEGFDLVISEARIEDFGPEALFALYRPVNAPVLLWTDDGELLASGLRLAELGINHSYRKLNRADLLSDVQQILANGRGAVQSAKLFLLVEDSVTVRSYVRRILADRFPGAEFLEAGDGKAALNAMKSNRIDVIVTDLQMPGMDGASFVQMMRNNAVLAKKPVIILSGMITAQVRQDFSGLPRLRLLPKPTTPEALEEAVRNLLRSPANFSGVEK